MADLTIQVWRQDTWTPDDTVELWVGSLMAFPASLAASTPEGGTMVAEAPAWPSLAAQGSIAGQMIGEAIIGRNVYAPTIGQALIGYSTIANPAGPLIMTHRYHPPAGNVCGYLPIGIYLRDAVGNRSTVYETQVKVSDPPRGARGLAVNPSLDEEDAPIAGEALLSWTPSPDVVLV